MASEAKHTREIDAERIKELVREGAGFWRSCSGCHETVEGYSAGFKHSPVFECELGSGCSECGGIGAVWDNTDYADMADFLLKRDAERDAALVAVEEAKNERDRLRLLLSRAHYELDIAEKHFRHPALPKDGLFGSRVNVLREDIRRELVGCPDPAGSSLPTAQVKG
mgnify:CR=1 FL=1